MEYLQGSRCAYMVAVLFSVLALVKSSFSAQYVVGNEAGWTLPSFGHVNYTAWASNYTFRAGDVILFNYRSDLHNVLLVDAADYNSCASSNPIQSFTNGKTVIELPHAGEYYYICGIPDHCDEGQKLRIRANSAKLGEALVPTSGLTVSDPPGKPSSKANSYRFIDFYRSLAKKILAAVLTGCVTVMI